jgi:ribulose-phosphate 3-epimerase
VKLLKSSSSKIAIEPSILSADFARLGEQAKEAENAGVEGIQIDVMDGHFVPNLTFGPGVVKSLRKSVSIFLDAHLMIDNPQVFLEEFARAGANRIIVHQEVANNLTQILQSIRKLKVESGVALNPVTRLATIEKVLDQTDCVQIMTVNPGFAGQRFMDDQLSKIRQLRTELDQRHLNTSIVVDGGIDRKTAPLVVRAGATVLVAGSSVYNQTNSVAENVKALRKSITENVPARIPRA